jgi:hypothetical protein
MRKSVSMAVILCAIALPCASIACCHVTEVIDSFKTSLRFVHL